LGLPPVAHDVQGSGAPPTTRPNACLIGPTSSHWAIFRELLEECQATGNLVSETHLAPLATEHGCEYQSTEADFSLVTMPKWRNPLR
jgi:hypothetical protein